MSGKIKGLLEAVDQLLVKRNTYVAGDTVDFRALRSKSLVPNVGEGHFLIPLEDIPIQEHSDFIPAGTVLQVLKVYTEQPTVDGHTIRGLTFYDHHYRFDVSYAAPTEDMPLNTASILTTDLKRVVMIDDLEHDIELMTRLRNELINRLCSDDF